MVIAESDLLLMFKKSLETYETLRTQFEVASPGNVFSNKSLVQLHADNDAILKGTRKAAVESNFVALRATCVSALGLWNDALQQHVCEYGAVIGSQGEESSDFDTCWSDIFRYYAENNKRVLSRGFVFGSPAAAGSNIGTGALVRLNTDAWGFTKENQTSDSKLARCRLDSVNGTGVGEELWDLRSSTTAGRDGLEEAGSGKRSKGLIAALSARTSLQGYGLQNPSFSTSTPSAPTTAPTDLGGWTATGTLATDYEVNTDSPYRSFQGDTTPAYLRCKTNAFTVSQNLVTNGANFSTDAAYYVHVAVRRKNSADGTLTLNFGRVSVSVDLSTLTNDLWTTLELTGSKCWYKNFGQPASMTMSFVRAAGTTGQVDLDDVTIGQFVPFDGGLYAFVGGATPSQIEDKFTFTDAEYGAAVNQKWFWRAPGLYLPSCPTAPAQPTAALAGAGAGNVDNGTHRYWTTFTDVNGIESGLSPAIAADVTVVDKTVNGKVTVTRGALPGVTTHLAGWNAYRSTTPASNTAKLVQGGISLGTAAITDNTADASLGAQHGGQAITFSDPP